MYLAEITSPDANASLSSPELHRSKDTAMTANILDEPEIMPLPHEDWAESSSLSISIVEGPTLNLWSISTATEGKTKSELRLQLQPDQSVVIGRQEGGQIEHLDPRYHPTQMLPNSNKRVVTSFDRGNDRCVSRGHFMLRGSVHGILFVNGVPRLAVSFTFFTCRTSRAAGVLKDLLGASYRGVIHCDRARMYWCFGRLQWCWAHLKRDFQALIDAPCATKKRLGHDLMKSTKELFALLEKSP